MRILFVYAIFMLGIYAGTYYSAVINAIVSVLCGLELTQFSFLNINIVKKNGRLAIVKRPFSVIAMSIFSKDGADEKKLLAAELAAILSEIVLGIIILFWLLVTLWGKTPAFRYIAEFTTGIITYCFFSLVHWIRSIADRNKSVDGCVRYVIKQLQVGRSINDIDISFEKLKSLSPPDTMRGIYLGLNFKKDQYNENYENMADTIKACENFIIMSGLPQKVKDFVINDIFTYYIMPQTIEREGEQAAKTWYEKWIKTLKTPYDAGDQRRIAAYNFYVLHDTAAAERALAIAEEKLSEYPGTPFEMELHRKEIDKLKKDIYQQ